MVQIIVLWHNYWALESHQTLRSHIYILMLRVFWIVGGLIGKGGGARSYLQDLILAL